MKIIWTETALNKLENIFDYLEFKASRKIAQKIVRAIVLKPDALLSFPKMGQIEPLLKKRKIEYRYLVEGNYKIVYSISESEIIIANIFDTRQNPKKILD